jgi:hypothetical protein
LKSAEEDGDDVQVWRGNSGEAWGKASNMCCEL